MEAVATAILGGKEQLPRPVAGPSRTGMKQLPRELLTCMQKVWNGFNLWQMWSVGFCLLCRDKSTFVNCVGCESLLRLCAKWAEPDVAAAKDLTSAESPPAASENGKRKADSMSPGMERIMKKRTLILGEEEESEDDQVSPHADGGSESGLKSGASLCDVVETKSPVTEVEDPLNKKEIRPDFFFEGTSENEVDPKEKTHVPQESVEEADPDQKDLCPFPTLALGSLDETAFFLKEAGYKRRDDVRDFVACCAKTEERHFNCLLRRAYGERRLQPFTQHIKEVNHLSENDWFFGMDQVEDLADFMWYIMQLNARVAIPGAEHGVGKAAKPKAKIVRSSSGKQPRAKGRNAKAVEKSKDKTEHGVGRAAKPKAKNTLSSSGKQPKAKARNAKAVEKSKDKTEHGVGRAAKPKAKNALSSSRKQPKAKARNAKAVEKPKDKADCALLAQCAGMEPPAELPGQDADSPNTYEKNKALLQAYRPEWSFWAGPQNQKLLACTLEGSTLSMWAVVYVSICAMLALMEHFQCARPFSICARDEGITDAPEEAKSIGCLLIGRFYVTKVLVPCAVDKAGCHQITLLFLEHLPWQVDKKGGATLTWSKFDSLDTASSAQLNGSIGDKLSDKICSKVSGCKTCSWMAWAWKLELFLNHKVRVSSVLGKWPGVLWVQLKCCWLSTYPWALHCFSPNYWPEQKPNAAGNVKKNTECFLLQSLARQATSKRLPSRQQAQFDHSFCCYK